MIKQIQQCLESQLEELDNNKMKAVKIFEKFNDKSDPIVDMGIGVYGLDIYTEVWTIINKGASEINKVYIKKEHAIKACEEKNKEIFDHYHKLNKNLSNYDINRHYATYNVKSLADAIDLIKDVIRDDATDPGEDY